MNVPRPEIEGVTLTELRQIPDERGAVLHMLRRDAPGFRGFGECYFSEVRPNAVKAWKRHQRQHQMLAVPVGRVRFVIYDGRPDSASLGRMMILELGRPDAYCRLGLPPGLWYGFKALTDTPALIVNCADQPHDPSESETMAATSATIPYDWRQ